MMTDTTLFTAARARWAAQRAAAAPEASKTGAVDTTPAANPPEALQADLLALRAAGLDFIVVSSSPLPPPPPPPRQIPAQEVAWLDARDPRRTLHQYQRFYSHGGRPVPQHIIDSLRVAAKDEAQRRRKRRP